MKYNGVVQRKLALLDTRVQRLRQHTQNLDFRTFADDWVMRSMAERALQVAAEIMIDIAERIIALEQAGPVASAAEAMDTLQTLGVIASAEPYRPIVRFRNVIVHGYDAVDPQILFTALTTRLDDFTRFRDEIDRVG